MPTERPHLAPWAMETAQAGIGVSTSPAEMGQMRGTCLPPAHSSHPSLGQAASARSLPSQGSCPQAQGRPPSDPLGRGSTRGMPHLPSTPATVGWCPLLASEAIGKDEACHASPAALGPGSEKPWHCPQLQASGLLMGQRIKNCPHHSSAHPRAPPTVIPAFPSSKLLTQFFSLPKWSLFWKSQKKKKKGGATG